MSDRAPHRRTLAALVAFVALLCGGGNARAGTFAVVVAGDPDLGRIVRTAMEGYFTGRGDTAAASGLDDTSVNALSDCLVVNDEGCARGVVAAKRKVDILAFAMVQAKPNTKDSTIDVTVTGWMFSSATAIAADRRFCEHCRDDDLRKAADELAGALAQIATIATGHLRVDTPVGARVLVDDAAVGAAPIDVEVPAGPHVVTVETPAGVVTNKVTVVAGAATDASLGAGGRPGPRRPSRLVPAIVIGAGVAAIAVGLTLIAIDEDADPSQTTNPTYLDTALGGTLLTVAGVATAGAGYYLWRRARPHATSAPTVSLAPSSMTLGWATSF